MGIMYNPIPGKCVSCKKEELLVCSFCGKCGKCGAHVSCVPEIHKGY